MEFFTIGVYNSTEIEFFNKLIENNVDTFCDIRQRRGVRGSQYAFVNNIRLQKKLEEIQIKYGHVMELAPSSHIRELQKQDDLVKGELKRDRNKLGEVFSFKYKLDILNKFDFENFIIRLEDIGAYNVALFCVEEKAEACHRSIVGEKLKELGFKITHL